MRKIAQLVQDGRGNETAKVLEAGMEAIGREVVELANRHSGDWPIVIACLRKIAEGMENSLPAGGRALLLLIDEAYDRGTGISTITVNREEMRRQREETE